MLDLYNGIFPHAGAGEWEGLIDRGLILDETRRPVGPDRIVRAGERYYRLIPATIEPDVNADVEILHEDEAILVLNKPAPLPIHPGGRFNRNTLRYFLHAVYHPQKPQAAHRLDANTTGLVVCGRTRHFAGLLQPQFTRGEVGKVYLARVHGNPPAMTFRCEAPISAEPGTVGAREVDETGGLPARTDFCVLQRYDDGTTLLEVHPFTGRTNQIRVHLWQLGIPVCGDQVYLTGKRMGNTQTSSLADPPLCLHAWRLTFRHPLTKDE